MAQSADWLNAGSERGEEVKLGGWTPVDVGVSCVNVVKSTVSVVGIAVHLFTRCVPRAKDACAMTSTNGVKIVFFGTRRWGGVGGKCGFRREGWGALVTNAGGKLRESCRSRKRADRWVREPVGAGYTRGVWRRVSVGAG